MLRSSEDTRDMGCGRKRLINNDGDDRTASDRAVRAGGRAVRHHAGIARCLNQRVEVAAKRNSCRLVDRLGDERALRLKRKKNQYGKERDEQDCDES